MKKQDLGFKELCSYVHECTEYNDYYNARIAIAYFFNLKYYFYTFKKQQQKYLVKGFMTVDESKKEYKRTNNMLNSISKNFCEKDYVNELKKYL